MSTDQSVNSADSDCIMIQDRPNPPALMIFPSHVGIVTDIKSAAQLWASIGDDEQILFKFCWACLERRDRPPARYALPSSRKILYAKTAGSMQRAGEGRAAQLMLIRHFPGRFHKTGKVLYFYYYAVSCLCRDTHPPRDRDTTKLAHDIWHLAFGVFMPNSDGWWWWCCEANTALRRRMGQW